MFVKGHHLLSGVYHIEPAHFELRGFFIAKNIIGGVIVELGMIGLGKMGSNMVRRLLKDGYKVVVWNRTREKTDEMEKEGATGAAALSNLINKLTSPRILWLMIPAKAVEEILTQLLSMLNQGDIVIDGANSNYHDSVRRGKEFSAKKIYFLDAGVSGGVWGLQNGYCLMVGGDEIPFKKIEPVLKILSPKDGYLHAGPAGAGHFAKMIHNGIEYGMLQAYGEGFELLRSSDFKFDLAKIAHLWNQGSVVRSWLLDLAERALLKESDLTSIRAYVEDSGEGRWTVEEAINKNIPVPVITLSLMARFASRQDESWSAKFIAALRNEFGGHVVKRDLLVRE